jgi:hypothetical protein
MEANVEAKRHRQVESQECMQGGLVHQHTARADFISNQRCFLSRWACGFCADL